MLGAVVAPNGQSVEQSVYMKSKVYRAEENAAIYRYYTGNVAQP